MLASTPIPIDKIIPAIPGSVIVKLDKNGKNPDIAASDNEVCPSRAMQAIKPGNRYKIKTNMQIIDSAITAAIPIAVRAAEPTVGLIEPKLVVSKANGKAPALIFDASDDASLAVKSPVIEAVPSVIAVFTVGADIIISSIHIDIVSPLSLSVASANFSVPSSVKFS